jgi:hypothetical protein
MPYNENFIDNFLREASNKLAQQNEQQVNHFAQPPAKEANVPANQLQSVALKLVQNLRQSYSSVNVSMDDVGEKGKIFQKNLFSLNSLLLWLAESQTRVNGHRVAYLNPPPVQPGSPAEQRGTPVGTTTKKDPNDEKVNYVGEIGRPQVWREGLIEFLKTLRKNAYASGNLYFQELVGKLIEDANTNPAFDTGLESEEKKEEKPAEQKQELKPLPVDPNKEKEQQNQQTQPENKNIQMVSNKEVDPNIQKSLQQSGGQPELIMPFELDNDLISIASFRRFLMQASALIENPTFNAANQNFINVISANVYAADTLLRNYQQAAANTTAAEGGFSLSVNTSVSQFVDSFADGDFGKARNLLLSLAPICTKLSYILMVLSRSPVKLIDDPELFREQIQRGQDYVNRIHSFVTQINNIAGRR